jgi:hypothetical protein
MTAYLMINLFYIEAGWPGLMAIRSRWQAFFSTSAYSKSFTMFNLLQIPRLIRGEGDKEGL